MCSKQHAARVTAEAHGGLGYLTGCGWGAPHVVLVAITDTAHAGGYFVLVLSHLSRPLDATFLRVIMCWQCAAWGIRGCRTGVREVRTYDTERERVHEQKYYLLTIWINESLKNLKLTTDVTVVGGHMVMETVM